MKGFLLDTHIWFWYLTGSERLPSGIHQALDREIRNLWLSPVSMLEIGILSERKRIRIGSDFRVWINSAFERLPIRPAPFNNEVALVSREIRLLHRDPADHILAATAIVYDLTLVTVDRRLRRAKGLTTLSK